MIFEEVMCLNKRKVLKVTCTPFVAETIKGSYHANTTKISCNRKSYNAMMKQGVILSFVMKTDILKRSRKHQGIFGTQSEEAKSGGLLLTFYNIGSSGKESLKYLE